MPKKAATNQSSSILSKLEDEELTELMLKAKTAGRDALVGECQREEDRRKIAAGIKG